MNKAQIAILGVALAAGGLAFMMLQSGEPPKVETAAAPPPVSTDDVLIAAGNLEFGSTLDATNVRWQAWPNTVPLQGVIRKSSTPNAIEEFKGAVVRGQFLQNEPIRTDRLVKGPTSNFMSTLVSSGKRAVAINIDASGATSAGGFILPNDRVDIIRTYRDEETAKTGQGEAFISQTIMQNVKVLAIGPNVQTENGKAVVVGTNATLELEPRQAEYIILAQRTGQLSLVLRSLTDALQNGPTTDNADDQQSDKSMMIVRFGVPAALRAK